MTRQTIKSAILIAVLTVCSLAGAQSLPDAPKPQPDMKFWSITALAGVGTGLDAWTTVYRVGHTKSCPYEVYSPFLYGKRPETARVSIIMALELAGSTISAYELKRHRAHIGRIDLWPVPLLFTAATHWHGSLHNLAACN